MGKTGRKIQMITGKYCFGWQLRSSAAVLAIVAVTAGSAAAQETATETETDTATEQTAADEARVYDTVTVRARKRDESIEDVPSSVTALSADAVDDLLIEAPADLVRQVPGAILVASGPSYLDDIALRGQGSGRLGFTESTTGIYRDGIFVAGGGYGGRTFSEIDFLDVQNVEVYRGPQGALYGRNAVGGAVNMITAKPVQEVQGRIKLGYNSVEEYSVEGMFNTPVSDTVALRVAGYYADQQDGFYKEDPSGRALDAQTNWGIRGILGIDASPQTRINLTLETSESEGPGFSTMGQNTVLDPDPYERTNISTEEMVSIDQTSVFAELTHDFSGSTLTVLGNYKQRDGSRTGSDFDHFFGLYSSLLELIDEQSEDFERQGLEVRLASAEGSAMSWMVGADYNAYTSDITAMRFGTLQGPYANSAALRAQMRSDNATEELTSYSIFGLVDFDLTDKLVLTLEGRIQTDQKDFAIERVDNDPLTDESIPYTTFSDEWTEFLPTISLTYNATENTTFYGKVATGYRPGGYNQNPTPGFYDRVPFDPEHLYSGEVGVKGNYQFGSTLVRPQLALFYSETDDVQQTTTVSTENTTFTLQNVGGNNIYGGEFELTVLQPVGDGLWNTVLGLSATNGEFDEGTSILFQGAEVDLSGERVPRTRDYMVNLFTMLSQPVTRDIDIFGSISVQAEGGGWDNAAHTRESEDYELLDLAVGLNGGNWKFSIFGKNVTDEIVRTVEVNRNSYYNQPALYGAKLTVDW